MLGGERDPKAYWHSLAPIMLTVPLAFALAIFVGLTPVIFGVPEKVALTLCSFILPIPVLGGAYTGIIRRQMPWYFGAVLTGRPAQVAGAAFLLLYAGISWFLLWATLQEGLR